MDAMEKAQMMEDCAANTSLLRISADFHSSKDTLHARCMLGGNLAGEACMASWVKCGLFTIYNNFPEIPVGK